MPIDAETDGLTRAELDALYIELAGAWWSRVPENLQAWLLKRAGFPAATKIEALSRPQRLKIAFAAVDLIAAIKPATQIAGHRYVPF